LISQSKGITYTAGVSKQGAEENTWTDGGNKKKLEKTA
jgi:hypothetical protein